jgi:hypothetical protein
MHKGQYIAHKSNAPRSSLLATVRALTRRADRIPSTPQARAADHKRVRIELVANGYTQDTYNRGKYRDCKPTQANTGAQVTTSPTTKMDMPQASTTGTPPTTSSLPKQKKHLGHISVPYCKARMMRKSGISTSFTTRGTLREQIVYLKDPIKHLQATCTIYHIACQGNPSTDCTAAYVGETGRATEEGMRDHRANVKHRNGIYTSKVKQHMHSEDHYFTERDITILDKDDNWLTRGIMESIQIRALNPSINGNQGLHKLPHCYENIIRDKLAPITMQKI